MQAQPNTEVNQLQDKLYRKYEVYEMAWAGHVDLSTHMVAGAASGGPIAMVRDENQMLRATADARPNIQVWQFGVLELHLLLTQSARCADLYFGRTAALSVLGECTPATICSRPVKCLVTVGEPWCTGSHGLDGERRISVCCRVSTAVIVSTALILACSDGTVLMFNVFGERLNQFTAQPVIVSCA